MTPTNINKKGPSKARVFRLTFEFHADYIIYNMQDMSLLGIAITQVIGHEPKLYEAL